MGPTGPCPRCGGKWIRSNDLSGLVTIRKSDQGINVEVTNFIPVRAYVCQNCGYVELYRETP